MRETDANTERVEKIERLLIKDFGPIAHGELKVSPLTILIGPNNAGKSFTASLLYVLNKAINDRGIQSSNPDILITPEDMEDDQAFALMEVLAKNYASIIKKKSNMSLIISNRKSKEIRKTQISHIQLRLNRFLRLYYNSNLNKLNREGKFPFSITVYTNKNELVIYPENNKAIVRDLENWNKNIQVEFSGENRTDLSGSMSLKLRVDFSEKKNSILVDVKYPASKLVSNLDVQRGEASNEFSLLSREIAFNVYGGPYGQVRGQRVPEHYYLPAGRSGLMHAQKVLRSFGLREISSWWARPSSMKSLINGINSDFLYNFNSLEPTKSDELKDFFKIALRYEKEILSGTIKLRTINHGLFQIPEFHLRNMRIPLDMASSTVTELTPIFLFLQHALDEGDTILIEEPEAHLHPSAQKLIARLIVSLIRRKLRVVITTHSEILLEEINNAILSAKLTRKMRMETWKKDDIYLKNEEVSVMRFILDTEHNRTEIQPVLIDEQYGIPQDEFISVHEDLYDRYTKLRSLTKGQDGDK